jgi:hypothetical protein
MLGFCEHFEQTALFGRKIQFCNFPFTFQIYLLYLDSGKQRGEPHGLEITPTTEKGAGQQWIHKHTINSFHLYGASQTTALSIPTASLVHPREVFAPAMEDRAASIIVAHNHPSGSLDIGDKDKAVTKRIKDAGELLGIKLDDHIIVTGDGFVSAL